MSQKQEMPCHNGMLHDLPPSILAASAPENPALAAVQGWSSWRRAHYFRLEALML